jgi:hypothetical protein
MFDFVIVTLALVALGPIDIPVKALRVLYPQYNTYCTRSTIVIMIDLGVT